MSEMIERVRQAIVAECAHQTWDPEAMARAAIEAMREPTTKMLHASTMQVPTWDNDASRRKWQAMIDAALSNGE